MIEIGKYNELEILRQTSVGLYLGDDSGEDVLLPQKYCPKICKLGDTLKVFVYLDQQERKVATNIVPKILLHDFALLEAVAVANVGVFMDWGMEKDLMVPYREQRQKMEEGRWYIVYLDIDQKTNRLYATNKIERYLSNEELTVVKDDAVDLMVMHKSDMGYNVIVNKKHKGLIFDNEVFRDLNVGDKLKGFVKNIREDNKIDISLQRIGYENFNDDNMQKIYQSLLDNGGSISITDKSTPDEIYDEFGISKKAFKKSLGALYKARKVSIDKGSVTLIESGSTEDKEE